MDDAKSLFDESLHIRRTVFGDEHLAVAESLNNIALWFLAKVQPAGSCF